MTRRVLRALTLALTVAAASALPFVLSSPALAQTASTATAWQVDQAASSIAFSFDLEDGAGGRNRVAGRFARWRADIRFDRGNLPGSEVVATIETASATDGVQLHDATMPSEPWFDAVRHPTARFRSVSFRRDGARYVATGELTIKGLSRPLALPFSVQISNGRAVMDGQLTLDRRDFDIGVRTTEDVFVGREITLDIHVEATPRS